MKPVIQMRRVMRDSIRTYFAPLTGAFKGIRAELHQTDREAKQHRNQESQAKKATVHHA